MLRTDMSRTRSSARPLTIYHPRETFSVAYSLGLYLMVSLAISLFKLCSQDPRLHGEIPVSYFISLSDRSFHQSSGTGLGSINTLCSFSLSVEHLIL